MGYIAAIAAAALGAGSSIYGASQAPKPQKYRPGADVLSNIGALNYGDPYEYGRAAVYDPAYYGVGLESAARGLFGYGGGLESFSYPVPTPKPEKKKSGGLLKQFLGHAAPPGTPPILVELAESTFGDNLGKSKTASQGGRPLVTDYYTQSQGGGGAPYGGGSYQGSAGASGSGTGSLPYLGKPSGAAFTQYGRYPYASTQSAVANIRPSPGLLELYGAAQPYLENLYLNAAARERAMRQDELEVAPGYEDSTLYNAMLRGTAAGDLALGTELGNRERFNITQATRRAQSARGFGLGPVDVYQEALNLGLGGEDLYRRRQQFALNAGQLASQSERPYLDYYLSAPNIISGDLGASAVNKSFLFGQQAAAAQPSVYGVIGRGLTPPDSAAAANTYAALGGGLLGLSGNLAGSYLSRPQQPTQQQPTYPYG